MQLDDLVVEVRDADLKRKHQIDARFLGGSVFSPRPSDIGTWQITLPAAIGGETLAAAELLRQPGSGIIVTGPNGVLLSGPTVEPEGEATADDPDGFWRIVGVSDTILLADSLAIPDPASANPELQAFANDIRTGKAETLLRQYVSKNIANGAIAKGGPQSWAQAYRLRGFRQKLRLHDQVDQARGPDRTKSPRYTNLLELCQDIVAGTDLLFDVQQIDDYLELVIWEAADLRASHRFDIDNDQLVSTRYGYSVPEFTEGWVAGQGEGTERTVLVRSSTESRAAEAAWRRPIERWIDQRQTDDTTELQQKVDASLSEAIAATNSLTVVPSDDLADEYGNGWTAGANITVVVGDAEVPARINQAVIAVTDQGVMLGCVIGDADGDFEGRTNRSISGLSTRVSSLERNGVIPKRLERVGHGTTAERDAYYGVPATDSARVALANTSPTWFNTQKGYQEVYYALASLPGLTVRGLASPGAGYGAPASGWYPVAGTLAYMTRIKNNSFQPAAGGASTLPTLLTPAYAHVGGLFTANGTAGIAPTIAGLFDITTSLYWSGGGAMTYVITGARYTGGSEISTHRMYGPAADTQHGIAADAVYCWAGQAIEMFGLPAAANNIYGDGLLRRTFLTVKYAGPPLAS